MQNFKTGWALQPQTYPAFEGADRDVFNKMKGIEMLRAGSADIVFLDFKMPGMNGVETLAKIREFNKTVPVVMVQLFNLRDTVTWVPPVTN